MKRFRTGRPASQWAGVQTGPMTVDVEALWANRDQNYRYMPAALTPPATQPPNPPSLERPRQSMKALTHRLALEPPWRPNAPLKFQKKVFPTKPATCWTNCPHSKPGWNPSKNEEIQFSNSGRIRTNGQARMPGQTPPPQMKPANRWREISAHAPGRKRMAESAGHQIHAKTISTAKDASGNRPIPHHRRFAPSAIIPNVKLLKKLSFNGAM